MAVLVKGEADETPYSLFQHNANDSKGVDQNGFSWYRTKLACEKAMTERSIALQASHIPHCPADYDLLSIMCWPPTPAGQVAKHPCTPDGYLNPHEFASRRCLSDATWYINVSFDRNPYTDFQACLTPWVVPEEEKLRKLAGDKIVRMLNSLDSHRRLYVSLYVTAIFLLAVSIILSFLTLVKVKVKQHRQRSIRRTNSASSCSSVVQLPSRHLPHALLAVAAIVLLVDNIVSIILSSSGWPDYLVNCRAYKSIDILSMLVFYQCMLGYTAMCVFRVLRRRVKARIVRGIIAFCVLGTAFIVSFELVAEIVIFPTHYCGFGNMQGSFHWLYTGPKYLIIMCTICLAICTAFGAFYLHQPSLGSVREESKPCSSREALVDKNGSGKNKEDTHHDPEENEAFRNTTTKEWFKIVKARRAEDVITLRHIRQGSVSVLITIAFSLLREVMVVLLHFVTARNESIGKSVAHAVAPHDLISHYARMYALATCLHGIVYAVAMCLCDVRVLAMLRQIIKSLVYRERVQSNAKSSSSVHSSHTFCCWLRSHKHQKNENDRFKEGYKGSQRNKLEKNNSPSSDVITPILQYSTPSPQHSRCLPVKASGRGKSVGGSPIALADNPTRETSSRPVLHPTIEQSPMSSRTGLDCGYRTRPDYTPQYESRFTYAHVGQNK